MNLVHLLSFAIQFIYTPLQPDLIIWLILKLVEIKEGRDVEQTLQFGLSYNTVDVVVRHMKIHANVASCG